MPRVAERPLMWLTCRMRPLTGRARSQCSRRTSSRSGSGPEPRSPLRARRADAPSERTQEPVRRSGRGPPGAPRAVAYLKARSIEHTSRNPMHPQKTMQPEPVTARLAARDDLHRAPRRRAPETPAPQRHPRREDRAGRSCPAKPSASPATGSSCSTRLRQGSTPAHRQSRGQGVSRKVVHQSLPGWWESENQTVTPDRQTPYKLDRRAHARTGPSAQVPVSAPHQRAHRRCLRLVLHRCMNR